tara:strand:- start:75 stop:758 length:684 start_codon:yes stop_codon:yes gene_type:complete
MKFQKELALRILRNNRSKNIKITSLSDKAIPAIKTMRTNLERKGFSNITKKYFGNDITTSSISKFEETIKKNIKNFYNGEATISTEELFHIIQLWGGGEGRYIYVRGDGFNSNFDVNSYKNLISASFFSNSIEKLFLEIEKFNNLNKYINVAFITKHTRFLTIQNKTFSGLPIYDSEMSVKFMHEEKPNIKDLKEYWRGMMSISEEEDINLLDLERTLFNYVREEDE